MYLQQRLQSGRLPVPQVEETVAGMMSVQTGVAAPSRLTHRLTHTEGTKSQAGALYKRVSWMRRSRPHLVVGVVAATAELVSALGADEVHAATFGQSILEPAVRTGCERTTCKRFPSFEKHAWILHVIFKQTKQDKITKRQHRRSLDGTCSAVVSKSVAMLLCDRRWLDHN